MDVTKYSQLELAKIFGEPKDPRKPYTSLIEKVCTVDTAEANEYNYFWDAILDTDKVYVVTGGSAVTQLNVTPDSPIAMTFVDVASPEYYVKLTDLTSAKERVIARKMQTLNRSMNAYENYQVINCMQASCTATGNTQGLLSGATTFNYKTLVTMMNSLVDYGNKFVLVASAAVNQDIQLWDWTDNKYTSLAVAFKDLNVEVVRVGAAQSIQIDGSTTPVIGATKAYLVATDTEMGKPNLFVRKRISDIDLLGGAIKESGEAPERIVFVSPNPVTVSTSRYLGVGFTGFEEILAAVTNPYGIMEFHRS